MHRLFRLSLMVVLLSIIAYTVGYSQLLPTMALSGRVVPGEVRVLVKDTTYFIDHQLDVQGTLIIEPGTTVQFYPQGRMIIDVGGRVIADGSARATYNPNPFSHNGTTILPYETVGSTRNPYSYIGYSDLRYFLYGCYNHNLNGVVPNDVDQTIDVTTPRDLTINVNKYRDIFDVVLDTLTRKIVDLNGDGLSYPEPTSPQYRIPFEDAIMFIASKLGSAPADDYNLQRYPWTRIGNLSVNIVPSTIMFKGQPLEDFSRDWGHIIVLPGARAAFFRNCTFDGMKKDSTVDRLPYYVASQFPTLTQSQVNTLNQDMINLTNGSGGAISTFSSRTWLLNCFFTCNSARYRGGALQILQSPEGFPRPESTNVWYYRIDKNPNLTDKGGEMSVINNDVTNPGYSKITAIDYIDEDPGIYPEPLSNYDRQYYDDSRIAVYLGRFRNLRFSDNFVQLANVRQMTIGTPPVMVTRDDTTEVADPNQFYGDNAFGGAVYISGASGTFIVSPNDGTPTGYRTHPIEIGLGVNNSINIHDRAYNPTLQQFPLYDTLVCNHNWANNYQGSPTSLGARGGAIYDGDLTSLMVAGQFDNNYAYTKFLQTDSTSSNTGYYSLGGAIFESNSRNRLTVRGGPNRAGGFNIDNPTEFINNWAGAGGAIYIDKVTDISDPWTIQNPDPAEDPDFYLISPIIGGSDHYIYTRDYGFNITFRDNRARSYGGAIFTNRNMSVNGAGGVTNNTLIGYGGRYPVVFDSNYAGYAGGAVHIRIPFRDPSPAIERTVQMIRANFYFNTVGQGIVESLKPQIRGGGAIYILNADLNLMKAIEFRGNTVYNGNGGAINMTRPDLYNKRFFLTDLDQEDRISISGKPLYYQPVGSFESVNGVLAYMSEAYPPDARMLTRFNDNQLIVDDEILASQSGSGTTQVGSGTPSTTANLFGVCFLDEVEGYAVGEGGTIIRLTQGGDLWHYISSGTVNRLNDIDFLTSQVGIIVGDNGTVLKTMDAGLHWSPVSVTLLPGWTLAGINFNSVKFSGSSSNIGYLVGDDGFIAKIELNLSTVIVTQVESGTIHNLYEVYFNRVHLGYAVGHRGLIIKLNDADGWDGQISNIFTDLYSVYFTNDYTGYAVGEDGVLLHTTNAGYSWDRVETGTTLQLNKVWFTGLHTGYIAGVNGLMLKSTDDGMTWFQLDPKTTENLNSIFFKTPSVGYVVGDYGFIARTSDAGATWTKKLSQDLQYIDITRYGQETGLPENGVGLGGAIYVLDSATASRFGRQDSTCFNRVRIVNNKAYTGSAIYSDNFDMKLVFNRSLITSNMVDDRNAIGIYQNAITGPVLRDSTHKIIGNVASSDLASTCIYGEIQGPSPAFTFSEAANSIYNNKSRFLIRLPDAPNTKGVLAGTTGLGFGGTDTLSGNYWGRTEANVDLIVYDSCTNCPGKKYRGGIQETFYLDTTDLVGGYTYHRTKTLDYRFWETKSENAALRNSFVFKGVHSYLFEGPFESILRYDYQPIPIMNKVGVDENTPADSSIPDILLMSGRMYDAYDKGTDIKTGDYSKRRMSPIEDFAVGLPPELIRYTDNTAPSYGKYVKCLTRDPFIADSMNGSNNAYPIINTLETEFHPYVSPTLDTLNYHPIGYPLFLETEAIYNGDINRTNDDPRYLNETVFFVINETTNDYIRVNLRQVSESADRREYFRARVELVPDSTNRYPNTTLRRTSEGLLNFGSDIGDPHMLRAVYQNPYNEDKGTLQGRKYHAPMDQLGNEPLLYKNRPQMPISNNKFNVNYETYFAGERYHALPVNVGDSISVVSRTILWRDGVDTALQKGLGFQITNSTMPPEFTGDIYHLKTDTIVKYVPSQYPWRNVNGVYDTLKIDNFLNKVFITEDREYPMPIGTYSQPNPSLGIGRDAVGRDYILNITAKDVNEFYDPRAFKIPDDYAYLTYLAFPSYPNSGLSRWLKYEYVPAGASYVTNPKDEAQGYLILRGRPTNPYVVPGGEELYVTAQNFPPTFRITDSLKLHPNEFDQDNIDKFIYLFSPYLNAPTYDTFNNARYLQQDTIDYGSNFIGEYRFKIFVVDSAPRFLSPDDPDLGYPYKNPAYPDTIKVTLDSKGTGNTEVIGTYNASVYPCRTKVDGRLKANLTNKLRFAVNFNTNDELEDQWAENQNWDFRYGRTAYGFLNIAYRPNANPSDNGADSLIVVDTLVSGPNLYNGVTVIKQARPLWMDDKFLYKYDGANNANSFYADTAHDKFGGDFTVRGELNIRVDSATAWSLLTPQNQINGGLNLDTSVTVVVNDGHGGVNVIDLPILVNVEPIITTQSLANAKEDVEYNPELMDTSKMIKYIDPNFGQTHYFEILYPGSYPGVDQLPRDPCFPDADPTNVWVIKDKKTAPEWLKINRQNGILYGIPGVKDAPRTESVTILCWDEDSLVDMKTFSIFVDSTNHKPHITTSPIVKCVETGKPYLDSIIISDIDFMRGKQQGDVTGVDTVSILPPIPSGMTIDSVMPYIITGIKDSAKVTVYLQSDAFSAPRDPDGKVTIRIRVAGTDGMMDTLIYRVKLSDNTNFVCPIKVVNNLGAYQLLEFGTGRGATTGEGLDGEAVGTLDSNFCEYEIPPIPEADVFDARWTVSKTNGILRNIFPEGVTNPPGVLRKYLCIFQSGGESGITSSHYPIKVIWNLSDVPDKTIDPLRNPSGASWWIKDIESDGNVFAYNMHTGDGASSPEIQKNVLNGVFTLSINRTSVKGFVIMYDMTTGVNDGDTYVASKINSISPNPVNNTAAINFGVSSKSHVRIDVVDELGRTVGVATDDDFAPGTRTITWEARDFSGRELPSGTYTLRMTAGSITSIEKMVILK